MERLINNHRNSMPPTGAIARIVLRHGCGDHPPVVTQRTYLPQLAHGASR
jgi:hypothetical protein